MSNVLLDAASGARASVSGVDVVVVQAASVAVANMTADTCLIILPP